MDQGVARRMGLPEIPEEQRKVLHQTSRMRDPTIKNLEEMSFAGSGGAYGTSTAKMTDLFRPSPGEDTHECVHAIL